MTEYIAAYDIGTSGVKAVLLDMDGNAAGIASAPYTLITPKPDWAERVFLPRDKYRAVYDTQYGVYTEIFPRNKDLFDQPAKYES